MQNRNLLEGLTDNLQIDKDKCIFCGKCANTCILDNIRIKLAPCRQACPLEINVQGYIQSVKRGRFDEARQIVREKLPFASIICRICDQPCQSACHRNKLDGRGIDINGIKRFLFRDTSPERIVCAAPTTKKIAIVGSGPSGIMAAFELISAGHSVTVFEQSEKAGGLLRTMLPIWKLPESVLDNEIARLEDAGVRFECGHEVTADEIKGFTSHFDAIVIATGAGADKTLECAISVPGVMPSSVFLRKVRSHQAPELNGHVVILGGGNVALDAAEAAVRQGAGKVTIIYRRTVDKFKANKDAINAAKDIGIQFAFTWNTVAIEKNSNAFSISCRHDMNLLDPICLDYPDFDKDETRIFKADHVILAVGQEKSNPVKYFYGESSSSVDQTTLQLLDLPVFVAGDSIHGPSFAAKAMASGREAAESINRMLAGRDLRYQRAYPGPFVTDFTIDDTVAADVPPQKGRGHKCTGAGDYQEALPLFTEEEAVKEASRCLSCGGPEGFFRTCWFCLPCEIECPEQAIWVNIPYLLK